jgi:hypothetical protein
MMPADLVQQAVEACSWGAGGQAKKLGEGVLRLMGIKQTTIFCCPLLPESDSERARERERERERERAREREREEFYNKTKDHMLLTSGFQ